MNKFLIIIVLVAIGAFLLIVSDVAFTMTQRHLDQQSYTEVYVVREMPANDAEDYLNEMYHKYHIKVIAFNSLSNSSYVRIVIKKTSKPN